MIRVVLVALLLASAGFAAGVEPPTPSMTKIVVKLISPQVDPDSFPGKPRTLYLAGEKYARIEAESDPTHGMHQLIVVNEPDMWIINLLDHTAIHELDKGPTFVAHFPIFPAKSPKPLPELEFGKEVEFFHKHDAKSGPARDIDQVHCKSLQYDYGDYHLVLYLAGETGYPRQLDVFRGLQLTASIRYVSYETSLPFAADLFKPPADLKITETTYK